MTPRCKTLVAVLVIALVLLTRNFGISAQFEIPSDAATLEASRNVAEQISTADWLGPLAPIALSPFFGLACLSGIATYGPEWLQQRSSLFHASSPLNNPVLFWAMMSLTIATSLPRLFKVSKPLALAAEKLEAYSAIIIFLFTRFLSHAAPGYPLPESTVALAGMIPNQLPTDLLIALAACVNIVVINAVKLFIEVLVWLIPFPFVDAMLEVINKSFCISLMCLYCYSPPLATIVNLMLLAVCSFVFTWVVRRLRMYRYLIAGPVVASVWPAKNIESDHRFLAFLFEKCGGLPKLSRVEVIRQSNGSWELHHQGWLKATVIPLGECLPTYESGILSQIVILDDRVKPPIRLIRRIQLGVKRNTVLVR